MSTTRRMNLALVRRNHNNKGVDMKSPREQVQEALEYTQQQLRELDKKMAKRTYYVFHLLTVTNGAGQSEYDMEELEMMDLPALADAFDEHFPNMIRMSEATATGGVKKSIEFMTSKKRAA